MLRAVCDRPTLWQALLPPEALVMSAELGAVDRLLDDPRFLEPFWRHFDPVWGRPSVPIERHLAVMVAREEADGTTGTEGAYLGRLLEDHHYVAAAIGVGIY